MSTVGLICAMKIEVPKIISEVVEKEVVEMRRIGENNIGVIVSGIGLDNAKQAAIRLCRVVEPDYLLCLGWCGAAKDFQIGQLLMAESVSFDGKEISLKSERLEQTKKSLAEEDIDFKAGKFETFDIIVTSRNNISQGVIAVDMESYAVADVAEKNKIPLIVLKFVSDIVPKDKPSLVKYPYIFLKLGINLFLTKRKINQFAQLYFTHC